MKKILIVALPILLVGLLACVAIFRAVPKDHPSFTAHSTLNGSTLTVAYPPEGFYGHGAKVTTDTSIHIEPTATYVTEQGSEFVVLDASISPTASGEASVKEVATRLAKGTIEESYAKQGTLESVNGHTYFVYKTTEDVTVWKAVMLDHGHAVIVTLAYKPSEGEASKRAYIENDALFKKILAGITL